MPDRAGTAPSAELITIGRANLDLYAHPPGVDFTEVAEFTAMVGGSPVNVGMAAARLGRPSAVLTGVGDDLVGDWVVRALRQENVDTALVARKPGRHTSLALVAQSTPDRNPRQFYRHDPADVHLTVEDAKRVPLDRVRALLASADALARGSTPQALRWLVTAARERGITTYLDLDLRPENWLAGSDYPRAATDLVELVDVVLGTVEEFGAVLEVPAGDEDAVVRAVASSRLCTADRHLVVKRGAGGCSLQAYGPTLHVPTFPIEVASTVGAGDAFAAGLVHARLDGYDWLGALRYANACGAITASRFGCSRGFPFAREVAAFLASHQRVGCNV